MEGSISLKSCYHSSMVDIYHTCPGFCGTSGPWRADVSPPHCLALHSLIMRHQGLIAEVPQHGNSRVGRVTHQPCQVMEQEPRALCIPAPPKDLQDHLLILLKLQSPLKPKSFASGSCCRTFISMKLQLLQLPLGYFSCSSIRVT